MGLNKMPSPFTDRFVKKEIRFMKLEGEGDETVDGVRILRRPLRGRCDDYLNKAWRIGELNCPTFTIDGEVWMSLTPMEIESNFLAWYGAQGRIGTAGLGIGYVAMKCASLKEVDEVVVFENNRRVVDFFLNKYSHRKELKKIKFVIGDVRKLMVDFEFERVYMDTYSELLMSSVIEDLKLFPERNKIQEYRFWGQELVYLAGMEKEVITVWDLPYLELEYFRKWMQTKKSAMSQFMPDDDYVFACLDLLGFADIPDYDLAAFG